jgi:hypothetical protein
LEFFRVFDGQNSIFDGQNSLFDGHKLETILFQYTFVPESAHLRSQG